QMKKKNQMLQSVFILLCILNCIFTGCYDNSNNNMNNNITINPEFYQLQEIEHLHITDSPGKQSGLHQNPDLNSDSDFNSDPGEIRAVWIPVMLYENWMKSETQFRESIREAFRNCQELGCNTIFVHVRAYCDAYYHSEIFPAGTFMNPDQDYDPLAIMLEEAHAVNLSVHAWINPMRAQTAQKITALDQQYILRQWYDDSDKNGTYLVNFEGRYYLNPAYPEVRELIADGVREILENYDVDGIHMDDYFYPTTDPAFDQDAFTQSELQDLAEFRRTNCSELVKLLYQTVKNQNPDLIFSISPQGNFTINYDQLYADVKCWCSEAGYCDWMIPQLYYGFENGTCPFKEILREWAEICTVPELVVGLAVYKIGTQDQWAGSGKLEFLTNPAVISEELAYLSEFSESQTNPGIAGAALYSYSSLFEPEQAVSILVAEEKNRIAERWNHQNNKNN
ncbi:MAG: family 10 glycosylhydrolase, partial [Oscillospiraceae bacterium]|nr:family 10 glycosylhydrolase [Oscillospiraceae bacterium]